MASTILPSPFPDDRPFTTADLQTFSLVKLLSKDPEEVSRLLLAGERDGFFYLDLTAPESRGLWDDYHGVLAVMKKFFDLPLEQKTPFAYGSDVQGLVSPRLLLNHSQLIPFRYKPIGTQTGATEHSRDGFETIRVGFSSLHHCSTVS